MSADALTVNLWRWVGSAAALAISSGVAVRTMRRIALKRALLDIPNERSSHRVPVPRLGGAAFTPLLLLALWLLWSGGALPASVIASVLIGAMALYGISLADDFRPVRSAVRFGIQLAAAAGVVWACARQPGVGFDFLTGAVLAVALVGVLNIYNFMDGIDGIAGLQGAIGGLAWCAIGVAFGAPAVVGLGACLFGAAVGFLTLNWPPAKMFMGDAGSTVLGFFFATSPLLLLVETGGGLTLWCGAGAGILILWPFLFDGAFTILRRLRKGENIFEAHRSHLYQRLVIAGKSHKTVTLVYGTLAAIGGFMARGTVQGGIGALCAAVIITSILFAALWWWVVRVESRR